MIVHRITNLGRRPVTLGALPEVQMKIRIDDLSDPKIEIFLNEHIEDMKSVSPPESKHALDIDNLRKHEITFWSVWSEEEIIACGALKALNQTHAEIKSMRVSSALRGNGVASELLNHILDEARLKKYRKLSLETGSMAFFEPARRLYEKHGFKYCAPFASYKADVNSVFMTLDLDINA